MSLSVEAFRAGLAEQELALIDALRALVVDAAPMAVERIKWNAPSFAVGDEDRITLGIERKGGVRAVLHRGARPVDPAGFHFDDPDRLAHWPAPDRGVLTFNDLAQIAIAREPLRDLFARWIEETS